MIQTNAINSQMGFKRDPNFVTVPVNTSRQPSLTSDTHITFIGTFNDTDITQNGRAVLTLGVGLTSSTDIPLWQYHAESLPRDGLLNNFDMTFEAIIPAGYYYQFNNSGTEVGDWIFSQVCEIPL